MALSENDVRGIADYARIALEGEELSQMTSYMNDAVAMLEPVLAYNLPDVDPTFHPIGSLSNVMRDDAIDAPHGLTIEAALSNAGATRSVRSAFPPFWERGMRNMASLDAFTARAIAAAVASGEVSAREIAEAALDAVDKRDADVQAFLQVTPELALAAADRIDAARAAGEALPPLAGVPLAVKDNMNLSGTYTTCASRMLEHYASPYTATCVQRMLDAGLRAGGQDQYGSSFAFGSTTDTLGVPPHQQPLGYGSPFRAARRAARLQRWLRAKFHLPWVLTRRLHPPAGSALRCGGHEAHLPAPFLATVWWHFGSSLDQVGPFGRTVEDVAPCHGCPGLGRV